MQDLKVFLRLEDALGDKVSAIETNSGVFEKRHVTKRKAKMRKVLSFPWRYTAKVFEHAQKAQARLRNGKKAMRVA